MGRALAVELLWNGDVVVSGTTSGTDLNLSGEGDDPLTLQLAEQ